MKTLILILLPFITFAQNDIVWHDLTNELNSTLGGWSIGNACGKDYSLHGFIDSDLDLKGDDLEILNSHVVIYGEALNIGSIVYLCDNSILEVLGGVLSVPDVEVKESFKVFPNPAIDEINIKGIEVRELELYDMTGRRIKHFQTFGQLHRILIEDIESGVYVLIINGKINHKIVKL